MGNKTAVIVSAPQFGRGANNLRVARRERDEVVAARQAEERLERIRAERSERVNNAQSAIETLLSGDKADKVKAGEIARETIRWLLMVMKSENGRDQLWAASKTLWLTGWRGMCIFREVEEIFDEVFEENIPDDLAEKLARLTKRDAQYHGTMRPGKTHKDRKSGSHARHDANIRARADTQSALAHNHMGPQKEKK